LRYSTKNAVTLKTGLGVLRGHWKCHHSTERMRLPIVDQCSDLAIRARGHSRSLKLVPFDKLPMVSY